jgi:hypothetical protein
MTEKTFSQKYKIPKLKSFVLILKEFGLDISTFYDSLNSLNELEDDICEECFSSIAKKESKEILDKRILSKLKYKFLDKCKDNKWNYKKAFEIFPQLRTFIDLFAKKLNHENKTRLKLEEKTLKLLSNDLKAIDNLVKEFL